MEKQKKNWYEGDENVHKLKLKGSQPPKIQIKLP